MPRTRTLRDEPLPGPFELVFRGILGDTGLDPADLRQAAVLNHELYGFYGISVWVADLAFPRKLLESTKLAAGRPATRDPVSRRSSRPAGGSAQLVQPWVGRPYFRLAPIPHHPEPDAPAVR